MNERIRELFLQAGFHPPVARRMGNEYKFEIFAELLIRECATIADQAEPYKANDLILKHFGFE